jgi:hypothetical protein
MRRRARHAMPRRRPLVAGGAACCLAATAGAVLTAGSATATPAPGSLFASLRLTAAAGGERVIATGKATHEGDGAAEGDVPITQTQLSPNFGQSLSSVVWPGTLVGNGGSTLLLIDPTGGKIPPSASQLNDPVRAQADTGTGAPKQVNRSVPGSVMLAQASLQHTAATADVGSAHSGGAGTIGRTHAEAGNRVTGPHTARSDAMSRVENFSAGVVTIGSVVSVAHTTTNGVHSTATGSTTLNNVKVAGVPVTVDNKGVHVKGSGPTTKAQNAAVNKALKSFQTQIYLVDPSKRVSGGTATYDAGGVLISLGDGQMLIYLGGAQATSSGTKGLPFHLPTPPPPPTIPPAPGTTGGTTGATGATTGSSTGAFLSGSTGSSGGLAPSTSGGAPQPPAIAQPPTAPAGFASALPNGINPAWVVAFLLGSVLMAAGLRRLPDRVLEASATSCPDGD